MEKSSGEGEQIEERRLQRERDEEVVCVEMHLERCRMVRKTNK